MFIVRMFKFLNILKLLWIIMHQDIYALDADDMDVFSDIIFGAINSIVVP